MKFKKQIVIICLFTFLFLPFQFNNNVKEVKAELLTGTLISIGVKEIITALVLSAGVILTDKDTHNAFVQEVYSKNTALINEMQGEIQENKRFSLSKVSDEIMSTIKDIYNKTYTSEVEETKYYYSENVLLKELETYHVGGGSFSVALPSCGHSYIFSIVKTVNGEYDGIYKSITVPIGVTFEAKVIKGATKKNIEFYFDGVKKTGHSLSSNANDIGFRVNTDINAKVTSSRAIDWDVFRDKNKDVIFPQSNVAFGGSICADSVVNWEKEWQGDNVTYPLDKDFQGNVSVDAGVNDDIIDKPDIDDIETPTTDNTLWDTLFGWLKALFSPLTKLLGSIWDLIKSLFDMLKGLLSSILDLLKSLVKSLVDAIAGLFVPTVALEDVFNLNQNTFFGQIGEVFNFDRLWNLTPKPYEFEVDFPFYDFAAQEQRPYHLEIKFFENKFMKENINLIRNITTYPLLLISIYFVIMHFLPKRDMD